MPGGVQVREPRLTFSSDVRFRSGERSSGVDDQIVPMNNRLLTLQQVGVDLICIRGGETVQVVKGR